jgi:hypothetical protein
MDEGAVPGNLGGEQVAQTLGYLGGDNHVKRRTGGRLRSFR